MSDYWLLEFFICGATAASTSFDIVIRQWHCCPSVSSSNKQHVIARRQFSQVANDCSQPRQLPVLSHWSHKKTTCWWITCFILYFVCYCASWCKWWNVWTVQVLQLQAWHMLLLLSVCQSITQQCQMATHAVKLFSLPSLEISGTKLCCTILTRSFLPEALSTGGLWKICEFGLAACNTRYTHSYCEPFGINKWCIELYQCQWPWVS